MPVHILHTTDTNEPRAVAPQENAPFLSVSGNGLNQRSGHYARECKEDFLIQKNAGNENLTKTIKCLNSIVSV